MKIGFVTFGCRLNRAEALDMEARYIAAGWDIASPRCLTSSAAQSPDEMPDAIVVRCCSVTAKAQRNCEKAIASLRERFPSSEITVTGCIANAAEPKIVPVRNPGPSVASKLDISRAHLKVQDGCSGKCAFCIVPSFRGTPVSVPFRDAMDKAREALAAGFREIVLTGCNLCLYKSEGHGLAELAAEIAGLESPGHRVRLGSIEPGICDGRIIDALEAHPNICRFLHLSLQSGSDRMLRLMRRPYTIERTAAFCNEARRRIGTRLAFGADIITGFPGETESDFNDTKSFLASLPPPDNPFIHLHVFPFSERPGTEAADLSPSVPMTVRRTRAKELESIGDMNRAAFAESLIGRDVTVCVERDGNGRTDEYLRCILEGSAPRRSLVCAEVQKYFPKKGMISATIRAMQ